MSGDWGLGIGAGQTQRQETQDTTASNPPGWTPRSTLTPPTCTAGAGAGGGFTMAMFLFERVRADVVALVVLVALGLTGLVAGETCSAGFLGNAGDERHRHHDPWAGLDRTGR